MAQRRALGDFGAEAMPAAPELRKLLTQRDPIVAVSRCDRLGQDRRQVGRDGRCAGQCRSVARIRECPGQRWRRSRILQPGPVKVQRL